MSETNDRNVTKMYRIVIPNDRNTVVATLQPYSTLISITAVNVHISQQRKLFLVSKNIGIIAVLDRKKLL